MQWRQRQIQAPTVLLPYLLRRPSYIYGWSPIILIFGNRCTSKHRPCLDLYFIVEYRTPSRSELVPTRHKIVNTSLTRARNRERKIESMREEEEKLGNEGEFIREFADGKDICSQQAVVVFQAQKPTGSSHPGSVYVINIFIQKRNRRRTKTKKNSKRYSKIWATISAILREYQRNSEIYTNLPGHIFNIPTVP